MSKECRSTNVQEVPARSPVLPSSFGFRISFVIVWLDLICALTSVDAGARRCGSDWTCQPSCHRTKASNF